MMNRQEIEKHDTEHPECSFGTLPDGSFCQHCDSGRARQEIADRAAAKAARLARTTTDQSARKTCYTSSYNRRGALPAGAFIESTDGLWIVLERTNSTHFEDSLSHGERMGDGYRHAYTCRRPTVNEILERDDALAKEKARAEEWCDRNQMGPG